MPVLPVETHGELRLAARPSAVPVSRRFIVEQLCEWGLDDYADACTLVGSELITNSVAATAGRGEHIVLRLRRSTERLVCEVWDGSAEPPAPATAARDLDEGGRGLLLVAAYCTEWGHSAAGAGGKVVWASWDLPAAGTAYGNGDDRRSRHLGK